MSMERIDVNQDPIPPIYKNHLYFTEPNAIRIPPWSVWPRRHAMLGYMLIILDPHLNCARIYGVYKRGLVFVF
jgi:hypothetical protein